jgi:hypothetical protein
MMLNHALFQMSSHVGHFGPIFADQLNPLLEIFKEALSANMVDYIGLSRRVGRIELGADGGILGTIHMLFATVTEFSICCHSCSNLNLCIGIIIQVYTILLTSSSHWSKGRQSSQQAHVTLDTTQIMLHMPQKYHSSSHVTQFRGCEVEAPVVLLVCVNFFGNMRL